MEDKPLLVFLSLPEKFPQFGMARTLVEQGIRKLAEDTPAAAQEAIDGSFRPAVAADPANLSARAWLAIAYLRYPERLVKNPAMFQVLEHLTKVPASGLEPPKELFLAEAEWRRFLGRAENPALASPRWSTDADVLYQRAANAFARGDFVLMEKLDRGAAFTAMSARAHRSYLERNGSDPALRLRDIYKSHLARFPDDPALMAVLADLLFDRGELSLSAQALERALAHPERLEPSQRERSALIAGKLLLGAGFAAEAEQYSLLSEKPAFQRLRVEARSELPETKVAYEQVREGLEELERGNSIPGINHLMRGVEANRKDPLPLYLLGRAYQKEGEIWNAADRWLKAVPTKGWESGSARAALARDLVLHHKHHAALSMLQREPGQAQVSPLPTALVRAQVQLARKRDEDARAILEAAAMANSRDPEIFCLLGSLAQGAPTLGLAEFYYATALRLEPNNGVALEGLAIAKLRSTGPSEAFALVKSRLERQPDNAELNTILARLYLEISDLATARHHLINAIRADRKYRPAFLRLGQLVAEEGHRAKDYAVKRHNYRFALASFEMAAMLSPGLADSYLQTADLYFDLRDLGAAAKNYHRVLEHSPNQPNVRLRLAQISRNGGDNETALKLLDEELKVNPVGDEANVERGNIFMAKKDFQLAHQAFSRAIQANPKNSDALFGQGVIYHLRGEYDNAIALFHRVIKYNPIKQDVYWQLGLIYQKQNNKVKSYQAYANYAGVTRNPASVERAQEKMHELYPNHQYR